MLPLCIRLTAYFVASLRLVNSRLMTWRMTGLTLDNLITFMAEPCSLASTIPKSSFKKHTMLLHQAATLKCRTYIQASLKRRHDRGNNDPEIQQLIIEGAPKIGRDWHCTRKYARWFNEVGFEDVVENVLAWPVGTWPKGKARSRRLWDCRL